MGFWSGLAHGTMVSAVALAALSLAVPRDRDGAGATQTEAATEPASPGGLPAKSSLGEGALESVPATATDAAPAQDHPQPRPESATAQPVGAPAQDATAVLQDTAAPPQPGGTESEVSVQPNEENPGKPPGAEGALPQEPAPVVAAPDTLPDPIGSEFRRAGDDMPQRPALQNAPQTAPAPAPVEAATEIAPSPATGPDVAPPAPAAPAAPGLRPPGPLSPEALPPELNAAAQAEPSRPVAAPAKVIVPADDLRPADRTAPGVEPSQDAAPVVAAVTPPAPAADRAPLAVTGAAALPEPPVDPQGSGAPAQPVTAPVQDRPAPVLSLPVAPQGAGAAVPQQTVAAAPTGATVSPGAAGSRSAPDLSVPRLPLGDTGRRVAPPLARPDAASPAQPDLTDIKPGATP